MMQFGHQVSPGGLSQMEIYLQQFEESKESDADKTYSPTVQPQNKKTSNFMKACGSTAWYACYAIKCAIVVFFDEVVYWAIPAQKWDFLSIIESFAIASGSVRRLVLLLMAGRMIKWFIAKMLIRLRGFVFARLSTEKSDSKSACFLGNESLLRCPWELISEKPLYFVLTEVGKMAFIMITFSMILGVSTNYLYHSVADKARRSHKACMVLNSPIKRVQLAVCAGSLLSAVPPINRIEEVIQKLAVQTSMINHHQGIHKDSKYNDEADDPLPPECFVLSCGEMRSDYASALKSLHDRLVALHGRQEDLHRLGFLLRPLSGYDDESMDESNRKQNHSNSIDFGVWYHILKLVSFFFGGLGAFSYHSMTEQCKTTYNMMHEKSRIISSKCQSRCNRYMFKSTCNSSIDIDSRSNANNHHDHEDHGKNGTNNEPRSSNSYRIILKSFENEMDKRLATTSQLQQLSSFVFIELFYPQELPQRVVSQLSYYTALISLALDLILDCITVYVQRWCIYFKWLNGDYRENENITQEKVDRKFSDSNSYSTYPPSSSSPILPTLLSAIYCLCMAVRNVCYVPVLLYYSNQVMEEFLEKMIRISGGLDLPAFDPPMLRSPGSFITTPNSLDVNAHINRDNPSSRSSSSLRLHGESGATILSTDPSKNSTDGCNSTPDLLTASSHYYCADIYIAARKKLHALRSVVDAASARLHQCEQHLASVDCRQLMILSNNSVVKTRQFPPQEPITETDALSNSGAEKNSENSNEIQEQRYEELNSNRESMSNNQCKSADILSSQKQQICRRLHAASAILHGTAHQHIQQVLLGEEKVPMNMDHNNKSPFHELAESFPKFHDFEALENSIQRIIHSVSTGFVPSPPPHYKTPHNSSSGLSMYDVMSGGEKAGWYGTDDDTHLQGVDSQHEKYRLWLLQQHNGLLMRDANNTDELAVLQKGDEEDEKGHKKSAQDDNLTASDNHVRVIDVYTMTTPSASSTISDGSHRNKRNKPPLKSDKELREEQKKAQAALDAKHLFSELTMQLEARKSIQITTERVRELVMTSDSRSGDTLLFPPPPSTDDDTAYPQVVISKIENTNAPVVPASSNSNSISTSYSCRKQLPVPVCSSDLNADKSTISDNKDGGIIVDLSDSSNNKTCTLPRGVCSSKDSESSKSSTTDRIQTMTSNDVEISTKAMSICAEDVATIDLGYVDAINAPAVALTATSTVSHNYTSLTNGTHETDPTLDIDRCLEHDTISVLPDPIEELLPTTVNEIVIAKEEEIHEEDRYITYGGTNDDQLVPRDTLMTNMIPGISDHMLQHLRSRLLHGCSNSGDHSGSEDDEEFFEDG